MDAILAGPDSQSTITRLTRYRFFNTVSISSDDMKRGSRALKLKEQREVKTSFSKIEDFLEAIQIRLSFSKLNPENLNRVIQLFQKTNQFNLTTRRHGGENLKKLESEGGDVYSISYEDTFGSQGIISAITLVPETDGIYIESWLMSCRVLNRTVEQAVFAFILEKAAGKKIRGEYIPTEKNSLVRPLYKELGFKKITGLRDNENETQEWVYADYDLADLPKKHYVSINMI